MLSTTRPAPATYYAGDFNRDGHVDAADILRMMRALADLPDYEAVNDLTAAQLTLIGDINGDGMSTMPTFSR